MYQNFFKRIVDLLLSMCALIVLSPVFAVLYIISLCNIGKPVLFKQKRCTLGGRIFSIYKFRSMTNKCDDKGNLLPDAQRRTKYGDFLRNSSLDELPEIWNIFIGDMSIIGPRPFTPDAKDYFTEFEKNRFKVRGGLIPPEVMYDNPTPTWDDQLKWEAEYALNCTVKNDLNLLLKVFTLLLHRSEANYGSYERKPIKEERKLDNLN